MFAVWSSSRPLAFASLLLFLYTAPVYAYMRLSDTFLRLVPAASDADLNPDTGVLLAPLLQPRTPGSAGHAAVQAHLVNFFQTALPEWAVEWQNSTTITKTNGMVVSKPLQNLIFRREPPWTRPGQANLLTLAAHYYTPQSAPAGYVGATDAAVSCALIMHAARSIERFAAQMYREMQELGEGGTVPMDMGVQIVFIDGGEGDLNDPAMRGAGSAQLAAAWERQTNPALTASSYGYPNRLNQISLLLLLDLLGASEPRVPSRYQTTHWAYQAMADVERRMRSVGLLETSAELPPASATDEVNFLPDHQVPVHQIGLASGWATDADDHLPFMRRGVAVLPVVPDAAPATRLTLADDAAHLDVPTVRDWSRVVTGFVMEWLDMSEVEPQPAEQGAGRRHRRRRQSN